MHRVQPAALPVKILLAASELGLKTSDRAFAFADCPFACLDCLLVPQESLFARADRLFVSLDGLFVGHHTSVGLLQGGARASPLLLRLAAQRLGSSGRPAREIAELHQLLGKSAVPEAAALGRVHAGVRQGVVVDEQVRRAALFDQVEASQV